jgi:hypothetical protein
MTLPTFTLGNGVIVLAKGVGTTAGVLAFPYHFANRTQAEQKAATLRAEGHNAFVYKHPFSRPFYVALGD